MLRIPHPVDPFVRFSSPVLIVSSPHFACVQIDEQVVKHFGVTVSEWRSICQLKNDRNDLSHPFTCRADAERNLVDLMKWIKTDHPLHDVCATLLKLAKKFLQQIA